jgi:hypothetical protein
MFIFHSHTQITPVYHTQSRTLRFWREPCPLFSKILGLQNNPSRAAIVHPRSPFPGLLLTSPSSFLGSPLLPLPHREAAPAALLSFLACARTEPINTLESPSFEHLGPCFDPHWDSPFSLFIVEIPSCPLFAWCFALLPHRDNKHSRADSSRFERSPCGCPGSQVCWGSFLCSCAHRLLCLREAMTAWTPARTMCSARQRRQRPQRD